MNARIELPEARQVCPTTTRRLLAEGAVHDNVRKFGTVFNTVAPGTDLTGETRRRLCGEAQVTP